MASGTRRGSIVKVASPALVMVALVACTTGPEATPPPSSTSTSAAPSPSVESTSPAVVEPSPEPRPDPGVPDTLTTGLKAPWSIAFRGDTAIVSERDGGRILEILEDGTTRLLGVVDGVVHRSESGLLGVAVHGERLYAYHTASDGNRIVRFTLSGAPASLAMGEPETILGGLPSSDFHDGGRIAFGPDGMLYATVGDVGARSSAQDTGVLSGKILRMTPDGAVPQDNPFPGSLVYSYGHRNPQGIAWGPDGTMYATEFGQNTWDELNIITPGGNYGWPVVEGIAGKDGFIDPVQQWAPADASPSGMAIAGGSIWIANLRGQRLREVPLADTATAVEHLVGEFGRLRDVTLAPDGSLRVLTNNTDGRGTPASGDDRILRITF